MAILLFWLLALIAIPQFPLLCVSGRRLTEAEKSVTLDAHNHYRRLIANEWRVSDMRVMVWKVWIALIADEYVKRCFPYGLPWMGNSWMGKVGGSPFNITHAVHTWYDEGKKVDNITRIVCIGFCRHFKVLANSQHYKIGCAISEIGNCTIQTLYFCIYYPSKNRSFQLYSVWKDGVPCSGCEGEWKNFCIDGLCSKSCQPRTEPEFHPQAVLASGAQKTTAHVVFAVILLAITHSLCTV